MQDQRRRRYGPPCNRRRRCLLRRARASGAPANGSAGLKPSAHSRPRAATRARAPERTRMRTHTWSPAPSFLPACRAAPGPAAGLQRAQAHLRAQARTHALGPYPHLPANAPASTPRCARRLRCRTVRRPGRVLWLRTQQAAAPTGRFDLRVKRSAQEGGVRRVSPPAQTRAEQALATRPVSRPAAQSAGPGARRHKLPASARTGWRQLHVACGCCLRRVQLLHSRI
jgi:hypothetical protein